MFLHPFKKLVTTLPLAFMILWPVAVDAEDCPLVKTCCEEDCCAEGSQWTPPACTFNAFSPGWNGVNSQDYVDGCVLRVCCEEDCCGFGTVFDPDLGCCVPLDIPIEPTPGPPTASPSPTGTAVPTETERPSYQSVPPRKPGNCTFLSVITLTMDTANPNFITSFKYSPSHSDNPRCRSSIDDGFGWFRFQRRSDAALERINRARITAAIRAAVAANDGNIPADGMITGGGLPPFTTVTVTRRDILDIEVRRNPNFNNALIGRDFVTRIEIFFYHEIRCICQDDTTKFFWGVLPVFLEVDATAARSSVKHNIKKKEDIRVIPANAQTNTPKMIEFTFKKEVDRCDMARREAGANGETELFLFTRAESAGNLREMERLEEKAREEVESTLENMNSLPSE